MISMAGPTRCGRKMKALFLRFARAVIPFMPAEKSVEEPEAEVMELPELVAPAPREPLAPLARYQLQSNRCFTMVGITRRNDRVLYVLQDLVTRKNLVVDYATFKLLFCLK